MRTLYAAVIVPLLFMLALAGCGEKETTGGPVVVPTQNNGAADVGEDTSESDADPGTTPDTGGEEPYAPGFMDGTWELRRSSSDALILTMTLMHKDGEEAVNGSFVLADDETSGQLNQGRWSDETFSIDWNLTIDGRQEQFSYNEARREDDSDERLMGRYNDLYEGQIVDARLVRTAP